MPPFVPLPVRRVVVEALRERHLQLFAAGMEHLQACTASLRAVLYPLAHTTRATTLLGACEMLMFNSLR